MYTILLVDDEEKIRKGLKTVVRWEELGFRVIGDCANGAEALRFIEEAERPDVLLSDIRMPVMDGIGLLEQVRREHPDIAFLILSGYDYFEYAKRALELGAVDYLLKPTKLPELLEKFKALKLRLDGKRVQAELIDSGLRHRQADMMRRLLSGSGDMPGESVEKAVMHGFPAELSGVVGMDASLPEGSPVSSWLFAVMAIKRVDGGELGPVDHGGVQAGAEASGLHAWPPVVDKEQRLLLSFATLGDTEAGMGQRMLAFARQLLSPEGLPFIGNAPLAEGIVGLSRCVSGGLGSLAERCREAESALQLCFYSGAGTVQAYDSSTGLYAAGKLAVFDEPALIRLIEQGRKPEIQAMVQNRFAAWAADRRVPPLRLKQACLETILVLERQWKDRRIHDLFNEQQLIASEFHTLDQLRQWMSDRLLWLTDCLNGTADEAGGRIVKHIQKIVADRYFEPLTLHSIAESLYMNPDYISRLFKKEKDISFSDYLTQYRIEAAKKMLQDISSKSYEVGYAVGYQNPSHFAKMFKKVTGCSVSEYREQK